MQVAAESKPRLFDDSLALALISGETGVWDRDCVRNEIHYSAQWKRLLGYEEHEVGTSMDDALNRLHPEDLEYVRSAMQAHFEQRTAQYEVEHRIRCKDGSYRWVCSRGKVVQRDDAGNPLRMIGTTVDITTMREMAESHRRNLSLLVELTDAVPGFVFQLNVEGGRPRFTYASSGVRAILGLSREQVLADATSMLAAVQECDRQEFRESFARACLRKTNWRCKFRVLRAGDNEMLQQWRLVEACPRLSDTGETVWHGIVTDISELKRAEHDLAQLASVDFLTQLINRREFYRFLAESMVRQRLRPDECVAVCMVDLDFFKRVNDTHGHLLGDQLLQHVAGVFRAHSRHTDIVGRLGGEEFGLLFAVVDRQSAELAMERLRQRVADTPLVIGDGSPSIAVTVSIGVTLLHAADADVDDVLARCDRALYRAKGNGRNCIAFEPPHSGGAD